MGIKTEYNPDLALRNIAEYNSGNRMSEECIPENLQAGEVYDFLKHDLRLYWLEGKIPLLETQGNSQLSKPLASIVILEATHFREDGKLFTRGRYRVEEVFLDDRVRFNGFESID